MDTRLEQINHWLSHELGLPAYEITSASADASFRRYFRIRFAGESRIVMDAPPALEDSRPFVRIGSLLRQIGLNVPEIHALDLEQGLMLLGDLGSQSYLDCLNEQNVDQLYGDALGSLAVLQACGPGAEELPPYDAELLQREMALFRQWYLQIHLGLTLSDTEERLLDKALAMLADKALEQPRVAVHRDYHSRNLMVAAHNPGILDFQDAVHGPLTYDLVSLLRDCYIAWPRERVTEWVVGYHDLALDHGILRQRQQGCFLEWFDWMGIQRHLKAIGIFARLHHRDGKPGYLKDIPRTLGYIVEVAAEYQELADLHSFLQDKVVSSQ